MHRSRPIVSLALLLSLSITGAATAETLATINGEPIKRAEVEAAIEPQLRDLDQQRHRAVEAGLQAVIEARLLTREAAERGIAVEDLVAAEVDAKIAPVTDDDVDEFYEANAARIRQPKDAIVDQVRGYLAQQRTAEARKAFMDGLRARYRITNRFEPLRVEVAAAPAGSPTRGEAEAPVSLVIFSDFQCPACKSMAPVIDDLHAAYPDQLEIAFRQFPLEQIHPHARRAGQASLCANDQGRFWEMHDALFANQRALDDAQLRGYAEEIGLDMKAFAACFEGTTHHAAIDADLEIGLKAGVHGTPSLFVNGRPVMLTQGSSPQDQLAAVIDDELARAGGR